MHIWGKNFMLYFIRQLCVDKHSRFGAYRKLNCSHGAVQSVVCHPDLTLKPLVAPLYIIVFQLFALRVLSHCKHEMATLSWLMLNTQKSTHPLLWRTCEVLRPWAVFHESTVSSWLSVFNAFHVHTKTYWKSPDPSFPMCDTQKSNPCWGWLGLACETSSECCVLSGLDFETTGSSVVCAWRHWVAGNMTWALFRGGNTWKSAHPPLWQTCKMLRPWALIGETTVQAMA